MSMRGRDEPASYTEQLQGPRQMDVFNKDDADKTIEANRADLRAFVWMSGIALVFAILLWLGLCNHV